MPKLTIDIEARLAQFQDTLTSISKAGDRTARQLNSAFSTLKGTLATIGVGLSAAGLTAFFKSGIDKADELGKLSQKVGVTVESLSALKFAADLSDVSIEQLQTSLVQLAKHAVEAQAGGNESADAFNALGIAVNDAAGQLKPTEELLLAVAERFAGMEDGAGKTAIAMRLFGRSGAELIPLLNQGRAGIEALRKEAVITSTEMARAAEQFNDNLKRLGTSSEKLKLQVAEGLLPALNRVATAMLEASQNGEGLLGKLKALGGLSPATDLFKAEREIVQLTDELLSTQNEIGRRRQRGVGAEELAALEEHAARTKARLEDVIKLRGVLSGQTDQFGDPLVPTSAPAKSKAPPLHDREAAELEKKRLREDNAARSASIDAQIEAEDKLSQQVGYFRDKDSDKAKKAAQELGMTFSSAFENAIVEGQNLRSVLQGIAQDILRIFVRKNVTEPGGAMFANLFTGMFTGGSGAGEIHAATGADFMVGGAGGTDSQRVSFWATPGERVTVTPPGQASGGVTIVQHNTFGSNVDHGTLNAWGERVKRDTVVAVQDSMRRGQRP